MSTHKNSDLAREQEKKSGRSSCIRESIFHLLVERGAPMTDREVAGVLGEEDLNNVRPEITRLRDAGLVREVGSTKCSVTRRKVRLVRNNGTEYDPNRIVVKGRKIMEPSPWNLSDEVPPPINHPVLVWLPYNPKLQQVRTYFGGDYWDVTKVTLVMKTYWRELPPNPTEY